MKTSLQCLVILLLLTAGGGAGLAAAQDEIEDAAERNITFEYGKTIYNEPDLPELDEDIICSIGDPGPWRGYQSILFNDQCLREELNPIAIDDEKLMGWGIGYKGYFFVSIIPGKEISQERMKEIYRLFERHATELGLYEKLGASPEEMPIPLVFRHDPIPSTKPDIVYRNGTSMRTEIVNSILLGIPSVNRASNYRSVASSCHELAVIISGRINPAVFCRDTILLNRNADVPATI